MSAPPLELRPDAIVGSYRLVREIGRGGMGTVFEARHTNLPRRAAVKVMHAELRRHPGMATRMVQEASILEEIRHPGVVRVYECSLLPDHRPYIAMELVQGETLATRLLRGGVLGSVEAAILLAEVSDVLAPVHARGIVHRDLKPDNLILTPNDVGFPLRVIDWGVARLGALGGITLDGFTPGTPIYMSPEQAAGRHIGAPCDVYSLGVIAYEALSGRPPFDGRTLAEVVCMHLSGEAAALGQCSNAPPALCELVHRMLDKDPSWRPCAIEVRQLARAIAQEHCAPTDGREADPRTVRPRPPITVSAPTEDAPVVDALELEYGVTELVPTIRRPRWTPEIARIPPAAVAGEILAPKRR
jgi:serine/threonine-protein kinase